MNSADPIRNKAHIKALTEYYRKRGNIRNYALIVMGLHTALRISDMLGLRWGDVYDPESKMFRRHITMTERKTGKTKTIALHKAAISALKLLFRHSRRPRPDSFLFESKRRGRAISRVQAYRIIKAAAKATSQEGRISCHSLRKTFGYHAWKSGVPLAVIMDIYNHSSFRITQLYLGISQDDKNDAYLKLNLT